MNILDNLKWVKRLDNGNILRSIDLLPKQIEQAWQDVKQIELPVEYRNFKKVVINGMGGSGLGGHIIQSLFFDKLKIPLLNIHSYIVPGSVDKETLYIISSYSGNTEEPLSTIISARKKNAKFLAITSGGRLSEMIKSKKIYGYLFNDKYNLSQQPRMGIGYSLFGLMALLKKCNLLKIGDEQIRDGLGSLTKSKSFFDFNAIINDNPVKKMAEQIQNRMPIIIIADFLAGNAHLLANQINENAKNFSNYFVLSELNHHLLESLKYPRSNSKNLIFLFFESGLYHSKNQKRLQITRDVLHKNKINYLTYVLQAKDKLSQSLEMAIFGSYLSFYLAVLNNVNPSFIPWVDYFKAQLK